MSVPFVLLTSFWIAAGQAEAGQKWDVGTWRNGSERRGGFKED